MTRQTDLKLNSNRTSIHRKKSNTAAFQVGMLPNPADRLLDAHCIIASRTRQSLHYKTQHATKLTTVAQLFLSIIIIVSYSSNHNVKITEACC